MSEDALTALIHRKGNAVMELISVADELRPSLSFEESIMMDSTISLLQSNMQACLLKHIESSTAPPETADSEK